MAYTTQPVLNSSLQLFNARFETNSSDQTVAPHVVLEVGYQAISVGNPLPTLDSNSVAALAQQTSVAAATGTAADTAWSGTGPSTIISALKAIAANGGGGGGGSATAANQVTQITQETAMASALGAPADSAWSGTGSSSVVAALKAIWIALTGTLKTKRSSVAYSNAIVVATSIGASSGSLITSGGAPTGRFEFFNNGQTGTIWVSPAGGTAVVGVGIPIRPYGSYLWANGLTTVPTGISDNGSVATSGSGGY